jgi:hypothetical protein
MRPGRTPTRPGRNLQAGLQANQSTLPSSWNVVGTTYTAVQILAILASRLAKAAAHPPASPPGTHAFDDEHVSPGGQSLFTEHAPHWSKTESHPGG